MIGGYGAPPRCVRPNEGPKGRQSDPMGPVVLGDTVGNGTEALRLSDRAAVGVERDTRPAEPICVRYPYLTTTVYSYLTVTRPENYPPRRKGPQRFGFLRNSRVPHVPVGAGFLETRGFC